MDETSNHSLEDEDDPPPPPPPDFDFPAFVLDNGTGRIKAGVCGTLHPSITIRSLIGRPIQRSSARRILRKKASDAPLDPVDGHPVPSLLFGPELDAYISSTPNVELSNAITSGSVTDWEAMERMWAYCYAELEVDAMSAPLLVTEPPMNPRRGRERMMEVFFETFQVPGYCPLLAGTCALYASGRTTGLVLDIGEGVSHITPVFESFAIGSAVNRHEVAGGAITQYLSRILSDSGYNFGSTRQDLELARAMKESVCFLRNSTHPPFDASSESTTYELPDGQLVQIRDETFRAAELLFAPSLIGSEAPPLHIMVHHAIQQCAIDMRKPLMSNIVLSGGTSLMQGLVPRLSEELSYVLQGNAFHAVKIIDAKDRADNVWIGASVVATLSTFNDVVLTKETYDEIGSSCLPALCV